MRLNKTVVMVGMMGSGKTAVGLALSRLLGVTFRDSDEAIAAAQGCSIAEIFAQKGEEVFRDYEHEMITSLIDNEPCVLSLGGGAFVQERNRQMIHQRAVSVWLKAEVEVLWNRVRHKNTRPLLQTANPKETLTTLCDQREPFYARADIHVISEADVSLDNMAQRVAMALSEYPGVVTTFEEKGESR